MPSFTVEEAYGLLRRIADREREAEHQAKQARQARDELIRVFDGQEGILRSGLARAAGISAGRITYMLKKGTGAEDLPESPVVPPILREVIEDLRPDLGRVRTLTTRA